MSSAAPARPIINLADAPVTAASSGAYFSRATSELAGALGARAIGANVTRVPPGKAAFPFHHHHGAEEHFFILSGTGVLRFGAEAFAVKPHDYIVNLPGGPERAHQLINTGGEDLVYLAIASAVLPEVVGYPDSAKTGSRIAWRGENARFLVQDSLRQAAQYWDGEDGAHVAAVIASAR